MSRYQCGFDSRWDRQMFCVYGLIDPVSKELRYIGYSSNYLERYKEHLLPSNLKHNTHKNVWLKSLLKVGNKPHLIILKEACSEQDGLNKEIELIRYFTNLGCNLTNGTFGGDGRYGFITPEGVKRKISQSMKGKNTKPEIKANCIFCLKEFSFKAKYLKRGHKFCSFNCSVKYRTK